MIRWLPKVMKKVVSLPKQSQKAMTEEEINSYRLTSLEDPSDEMLSYIMKEVAEEARESYEEALKKFFEEIKEMYQKEYGNK